MKYNVKYFQELRLIVFCIPFLLLSACSTSKYVSSGSAKKSIGKLIADDPILNSHHLGILITDRSGKEIYSYNANKHFVPASNMKIYTLNTALNSLGERMPFIDYTLRDDSMFIWGIGDPSFMNEKFQGSKSMVPFFENHADYQLVFSNNHMKSKTYGPGWAWDDYLYYFQTERTFFPFYGNVVSFVLKDRDMHEIKIQPKYFIPWTTYFSDLDGYGFTMYRDRWANAFDYNLNDGAENGDSLVIPFTYDDYFFARMLKKEFDRPIAVDDVGKSAFTKSQFQRLYSIPTDSIYRVLMHDSDNFIAEQLLLASQYVKSGYLNAEAEIEYQKKILSRFLPDSLEWYDGSGLSRYNLTTPANNVALLQHMLNKYGFSYLSHIFPSGGKTGTLRYRFKADTVYMYAKSGSLKHHYNLSGFLLTESGEILIFSWMNAGFPGSNKEVVKAMEPILKSIAEKY